jgi:prepilin-type processing-associated H-X9-DG protein
LLTPNSSVPDCSISDFGISGGGPGIYSARSLHKGGVNILMADGSGLFISQSIDLNIWQAIGTRNGNEAFDSL